MGLGHLSYHTNTSGEDWDEMKVPAFEHLPKIF